MWEKLHSPFSFGEGWDEAIRSAVFLTPVSNLYKYTLIINSYICYRIQSNSNYLIKLIMRKLLFAFSFFAFSTFSFAGSGDKYKVSDAAVDQMFAESQDISSSFVDEISNSPPTACARVCIFASP